MFAVQYIEVPVADLRPNPFNPNRVSADNEQKIRASIERNGIFKPIIVREVVGVSGYEIIGGQHRWEQATALGMLTVPVANLGQISDVRAKEIGLLDNARYGSDDTLMLSTILKEIGDVDEIQTFLPYGETDLSAIFSASSISLDDLIVPQDELKIDDDAPEPETAPKPTKTHQVMRFKIGLSDAERLTALIARTQKEQGLTTADELTNAGDALIHLLSTSGHLSQATTTNTQPADWDDALDQIEAAQKEGEQ
ncbi:ParB N-terminal domain-containing protein [Rhodobacteraceae bacterium R_SAG4]|nr:ParB N-terminal domain-containing protein [Rhodobacteraceae bacterium R_SAG4]